jgi:hypothetical protein
MSETPFRPDLSDKSRCGSVHWSLPVQCVLKRTHRENWHEAWHPESGNRMRYRYPIRTTQELRHGEWTTLYEPPITSLPAAVAAQGALPVPVGDQPQPLNDTRLAEIAARVEAASKGPWTVCEDYSDVLDGDGHQIISHFHDPDGQFTAHARQDVPALLAEVERLKAELARSREDAAFMERNTLPELRRTVEHHQAGEQRWRERAEKAEARPSRFHATPAQIDAYLRTILAEDTHLRYQQAIGEHALAEAIEDAATVRASADSEGLYNANWREGWDDAISRVDPDQNGPTPSTLITFADAADSTTDRAEEAS